MKFKKRATTLVKIIFAVGLVSWLILTERFKLSELKPFLYPLNFIIGFALVGLNLFFASERWRLLMRSHDLRPTIWKTWKLALTGVFFNFAVPGGVGGDVIKAYYLQKDLNASRAAAYSSALMDRLVGLYTCIVMALVALVFEKWANVIQTPLLNELLIWVSILWVGMTFSLLVLAFMKWPAFMKNSNGLLGFIYRFADACQYYFRKPGSLFLALILTFLGQLMTIVFFRWAFGSVLDESVSWTLLFFVIPVGFMIMAVPITPAGVGVGQAAFYFLFSTFSDNQILSGSSVITAFQMINFAWGLFGAYYYLTRKSKLPLPPAESQPTAPT